MNPINKITSSLKSNAVKGVETGEWQECIDVANTVLQNETVVYNAQSSSLNNSTDSDRNWIINEVKSCWIAKSNSQPTLRAEITDKDDGDAVKDRTMSIERLTLV